MQHEYWFSNQKCHNILVEMFLFYLTFKNSYLTCHDLKVWIILFGVCFYLYILLNLCNKSNSLRNIYLLLQHKWWWEWAVKWWGHIQRQRLSKILATHALDLTKKRKNIFFRFIFTTHLWHGDIRLTHIPSQVGIKLQKMYLGSYKIFWVV